MKKLQLLPGGVYRHYKGQLYQVIGYAHDANADTLIDMLPSKCEGKTTLVEPVGERIVVVYIGLQLDAAHLGPRMAVRSVDDFNRRLCGYVHCPRFGLPFESGESGGCCDCNNVSVPRFHFIGTQLTEEML